ncbi:MAG: DUF1844 domain-containing protein [Phycisphaerae bacterium]|nr:DUF1844 domain-containing protein [Phycisphaerae bacterium]
MSNDPGQAPKIIVDSDWKSQAQAEKDRLAADESKREAEASRKSSAGAGEPGELPPADFQSLVGMLVTQALMYLGGVADRKTGQAVFDPDMSRFYIDLLAVLEEKTRGNLAESESRDLVGAVNELRSRYVELVQMVARQAAAAGPGGPIPSAGPTPFRARGAESEHRYRRSSAASRTGQESGTAHADRRYDNRRLEPRSGILGAVAWAAESCLPRPTLGHHPKCDGDRR